MTPLKRLLREIHRRSLWQVLGIYLVGGWVAFEVVHTLTEGLGLPEWFPALAVVLLIIGLPVVMATAFVQEGGPDVGAADTVADLEGILKGEDGAPTPPTRVHRLFTWRNAVLGASGAFVLLVTVAVSWIGTGGGRFTSQLGLGSDRPVGAAEEDHVEQSVAVLPFENMSADPDNEYFSDGITEELLNALAQIPNLRVPGRTSSFAFKDQTLTIQQIADTLDVDHVLEGSVRRAGDRVLITAQLVDARTDSHLWSDTYERRLDDIFAVQREIARAIVDRLELALAPDEETRLVSAGTENPDAHEAYLRGLHFLREMTASDLRTAVTEFQRALDADPGYASAWAGLALSHQALNGFLPASDSLDRVRNMEDAWAAARRAVHLAPDLEMGHRVLGLIRFHRGDWQGAEDAIERAIRANPGSAGAHNLGGRVLLRMGRATAALPHLERARQLDPVFAPSPTGVGDAYRALGRHDEAIRQYREAIELDPSWYVSWFALSQVLLKIGRYDEGLDAYITSARLRGQEDPEAAAEPYRAAIRYQRTGEPQPLPPLEGVPHTRVYWLATQTGNTERALEVFEGFVRRGELGAAATVHTGRKHLQPLAVETDPLSVDPRYQALLDEAGITW